MDYERIKTAVGAFHQRHGPESYSDGTAIYYANGAVRDVHPIGALIEPPQPDTAEKEWVLRSNQLMFSQLKLKQAVDQFDELNTRLANWIPADPESEIAKLEQLKVIVEERKKLLKKAEDVLENTRWGKRRREMQRQHQEQAKRMADFHQRRRAIRI